MSHDEVGFNAIGGKQACEGEVGGKNSRLRDCRLTKIVFGSCERVRVAGVDEDEVAERLAEDGCHDPVGFGERISDDGLARTKRSEHVQVLRTLAWIEEGHLRRRTVSAEDALGAQDLPNRRLIRGKSLQRGSGLSRQVRRICIVDRESFGRAQIRLGGGCGSRRTTRLGIFFHRAQTHGQRSVRLGTNKQYAAKRSFA